MVSRRSMCRMPRTIEGFSRLEVRITNAKNPVMQVITSSNPVRIGTLKKSAAIIWFAILASNV